MTMKKVTDRSSAFFTFFVCKF